MTSMFLIDIKVKRYRRKLLWIKQNEELQNHYHSLEMGEESQTRRMVILK